MEERRGLGKHWWILEAENILTNVFEVGGNVKDLYLSSFWISYP